MANESETSCLKKKIPQFLNTELNLEGESRKGINFFSERKVFI